MHGPARWEVIASDLKTRARLLAEVFERIRGYFPLTIWILEGQQFPIWHPRLQK